VRLATFRVPGRPEPIPGEVVDDRVVALESPASVRAVLAGEAATRGDESFVLADVTLLAPIPRPAAIYCIGLNYAKHIEETAVSGRSSRSCSSRL
jgi:2-keto-4-pentenoate hydratase/2-oxohepta-3-ene-1,7-dioic acid hydratase in catechol pathway